MLPSFLVRRTSIALAALVIVAIVLGTVPAFAAVFTVTTTFDEIDGPCTPADCSLREAVIAANAAPDADTIVLLAGTYVLSGAGGEDLAASGDLDLRGSVTIQGAGATTTIIDGGGVDRIFDVVESATVIVRDLTLRNGRVPAGDTQGGGAILWNEPDGVKKIDLRLERVIVTGNDGGSGIDGGGGIRVGQDEPAAPSQVTITDSTISDNTMASGDGGGLHLCCDNLTVTISGSTITGNAAVDDPATLIRNGEGGGIYHCCTNTTLTITDSTVSDNDGPTQGGGIYTCCGVESDTLLTVERSTVSENRTLGPAAFQGFGGGIEGEGAVTLVNATLSGNRALRDGGGIENEDVLVMRNVTIAENEAGRGGGFYESIDSTSATLGNVLLAGNVATPTTAANCAVAVGTDPLVSEGGNLSSDGSCPLAGTGDRAGVDPLLGPLADNGGPTRTHALAPASPAVDAGNDAICQAVDQRGFPRPVDGNDDGSARCDVGAFERSSTVEDCNNGIDDNGNGLVDCLDFDCAGQPSCHERCDDCIDDDGDGKIDRDDPDCVPPADGGGTGVGDPKTRGLLVGKCAAGSLKAGAKLVAARAKTLHACLARLGACVQTKAAGAGCLAKAGNACTKALAKLDAVAAKSRAVIVRGCDPLTSNELLLPSGLGYGADVAACADRGVPTLATADDVARCLVAEHACDVDRLVTTETPRARELFALGGIDPDAALACATGASAGDGGGLGKAVAACQSTIQKATAKLTAGTTALLRRCAADVFACRQEKPGDARCLAKAASSCPKLGAKIASLATKTATTIAKRCDVPTLTVTELLGAPGVGFQTDAAYCKALGVPALGSVAAVTDCLTRHEQCRARQLVEREVPRLDELLGTGGLVFP